MAKLSSDGKYVTVEKGDTLSAIAKKYGNGKTYKQLASINNISNPNLIYIGQKIYLSSDGSSSSGGGSTTNSNKPTINQFGELSSADNTLFATWTWSKSNTEKYKILWTYDTGDGVWFSGNNTSTTVDVDAPELSRQSTFTIPGNARKVRFKVKPVSKKQTKNGKETSYWEAEWSDLKTWTDSTPLETPSAPNVKIEKYKLTATLDGIEIDATGIEFEVVKDNAKTFKTGKATISTGHASFSCTVDAGSEYKVRCRAYKGSDYSDWSGYTSNVGSMPAATSGITSIKATSETSVYLEWAEVKSATSYDIEYTTKLNYFDGSDQTTTKNGIEGTHFELVGLESGEEYFFRVRAVNDDGSSPWCDPKSVKIGEDPAAPTTWSSTTTAIVGEVLTLYWVHNSVDSSSQTYAELEITVGNSTRTYTIKNDRPEKDKDKTSSYIVDTTSYPEGTKILWRVRTAGVTLAYGEWSVQRTVDIYAPPTLELTISDSRDNPIDTVRAFPIKVHALAGPKTQAPTSYHLSVVSNEMYETTDNVGNQKTINQGEEVYSQHFDISTALDTALSAGDIDLANNINYTITCAVSMNSGLRAETSVEFNVTWEDTTYEPNAEISIDEETFTASIRPYCNDAKLVNRVVTKVGNQFTEIEQEVGYVYGTTVKGVTTNAGNSVYTGTTSDGEDIYFTTVEEVTPVSDVLLSVYRREFDGSFTELATDLDGANATTVIDPHPSLDYARYRIVATSKTTGAVNFYDPPGYPVGGKAVIVQWDEAWSTFETDEESSLEQPPWSGSMLKLPYNIDVSDSHKPDAVLVEYIGRSHPVAYYGTQLGTTSSWSMTIPKSDKDTLYGLRRLARWLGNVYVREPSGSGYWANIVVSFSQKHGDVTIPVSFSITRVEGGA